MIRKSQMLLGLTALSLTVILGAFFIFVLYSQNAKETFTHSEARFCFTYPRGWTVTEFFQDGEGIILRDPVAIKEGVTEYETATLQAGAYITFGQETILSGQENLSVFTPDGWLANSLGGGSLQVREKKTVIIDGQKGLLAVLDPRIVNGQIPQGVAGYYRLEAFVRDGNMYYDFGSFFVTEQARRKYKSQFENILRSFRFSQHCT